MQRTIFDIQAEFCKAMGNATRLQILHILRKGSMTVSEITEALGRKQSMISRQLSVLRSVGVVSAERNGVEVRYQVTDEKIGELCDLVREVLIEQSERQALTMRNL